MPRFYFHVRDDVEARDVRGQELPSPDAAYEEALRRARDIASNQVRRGELNLSHRIIVEDENLQQVCIVWFDEAVEVKR